MYRIEIEISETLHKDYRFGSISLTSYDMLDPSTTTEPSQSTSPQKTDHVFTVLGSFIPYKSSETILSSGVVHLYRKKSEVKSPPLDQIPISSPPTFFSESPILSVLAVPSYMTAQDFINFIGAYTNSISNIRLIRDAQPIRYMVLLKFRSAESAEEFFTEFNGAKFNSMEPEICKVVYVDKIEFKTDKMAPFVFPLNIEESNLLLNRGNNITNEKSKEISPTTDTKNFIELPTCPVCLDRMDSTVTGLLTIICQHTFHCHCLSKWNDFCPVCRYSFQNHQDDFDSFNECANCQVTANLWICLVCGNIGCGRYKSAHAQRHFEESGHCYSMELETQRVWDYVGDGYVHRLIQSKSDGKLVELPAPQTSRQRQRTTGGQKDEETEQMESAYVFDPDQSVPREKFDAVGLEYSYLLTSQLESQRHFFEAQIEKLSKATAHSVSVLQDELRSTSSKLDDLTNEFEKLGKEKMKSDKKVEKFGERIKSLESELKEEKELNKGLQRNQIALKVEIAKKDQELKEKDIQMEDLNAQVKDLMFYIETLQKVQGGELEGGQLVVEQTPTKPPTSKKKGKK
ncbi:hypothetical protein HK098_001328 [Nowakowskiella sp. JEL0407]|nr:hypothetical protein HK098_001328 [Nowakowskiella sp. JEL0407]